MHLEEATPMGSNKGVGVLSQLCLVTARRPGVRVGDAVWVCAEAGTEQGRPRVCTEFAGRSGDGPVAEG